MGVRGLDALKDRPDDYCNCPDGSVNPECPIHNQE